MTSDQQQLDVGVDAETSPEDYRDDRGDSTPVDTDVDEDESTSYPGGDTRECTYTYDESVCENHPCPGRREQGELDHHQFTFVSINGDDEYEEALKDKMTPETCSCGGEIETKTVAGVWPLEDLTTEAILELFQESNGQIVIEFYPRDRDRRFYIGEIDGSYYVETEDFDVRGPNLPTGVDDLPDLIRDHPNRLSSVEDTALEGTFEDYQNGEV